MTDLASLKDSDLLDAVRKHGSLTKAATALDTSRSCLTKHMGRRELAVPAGNQARRTAKPQPTLTLESLHQALEPPNLCRVRTFLDALDTESREVVEEALGYVRQDFSAAALQRWLIEQGCDPSEVPGNEAINAHRSGKRPCRCRG